MPEKNPDTQSYKQILQSVFETRSEPRASLLKLYTKLCAIDLLKTNQLFQLDRRIENLTC